MAYTKIMVGKTVPAKYTMKVNGAPSNSWCGRNCNIAALDATSSTSASSTSTTTMTTVSFRRLSDVRFSASAE
jgi:hypothetical protein